MESLKELVEKIINYTSTWSITETEWYWNVECVRKSENRNEKNITWEEFERAIREEILYDLVYRNGACLRQQMENDYEYGYFDYEKDEKTGELKEVFDKHWESDSIKLEKEVKKIISDFKVSRLDINGKTYYLEEK